MQSKAQFLKTASLILLIFTSNLGHPIRIPRTFLKKYRNKSKERTNRLDYLTMSNVRETKLKLTQHPPFSFSRCFMQLLRLNFSYSAPSLTRLEIKLRTDERTRHEA